jgi:peptidoglycan hydrolase-like protein with peptidoglycan-binding domain
MKNLLLTLIICLSLFGNTAQAQEPTREELLAQLESLTQILAELQARVASTSTAVGESTFSNLMVEGSENDSVALLQRVLASDPNIYPEALVTGYFGDMTENALRRFQTLWNLEVTGTFTNETRFVLSAALAKKTLSETSGNYLQDIEVQMTIVQAIGEFASPGLITSGYVAFAALPNFSSVSRSTDVLTLQRILASDPVIYPEQALTGVFDAATAVALSRLQVRYGIPTSGEVDASTLSLLKALLQENAAPTVANDLLIQPETQPTVLVENNDRTLFNISAIPDTREGNIRVTVTYEGGITDTFMLFPAGSTLGDTEDRRIVLAALVTQLGRDEDEIDQFLTFNTDEGPDFPSRIIIQIGLQNEISIFMFQTSGLSSQYSPAANLNLDEEVRFNNRTITIEELGEIIVDDARAGEPVDEDIIDILRDSLADLYRVRESRVPVIPVYYNVEQPIESSLGN